MPYPTTKHTHTEVEEAEDPPKRAVLAAERRQASTQQLLQLVAEAEGLGGQEVARAAKLDLIPVANITSARYVEGADGLLEGMEGMLMLRHTRIWRV